MSHVNSACSDRMHVGLGIIRLSGATVALNVLGFVPAAAGGDGVGGCLRRRVFRFWGPVTRP